MFSYVGRNRKKRKKKKQSRCQEAEVNVGGNVIHLKSAALPGKPRLFSVPTS